MKQETNGARRKGMWIAAAATVLTVAFGVTAGGLLGYGGSGSSADTTSADVAGSPAIIDDPTRSDVAGPRATAVDPTASEAAAPSAEASAEAPTAFEPEREEHRHGHHEARDHERREHERREHAGRGEHGEDDDD